MRDLKGLVGEVGRHASGAFEPSAAQCIARAACIVLTAFRSRSKGPSRGLCTFASGGIVCSLCVGIFWFFLGVLSDVVL